MDSKSLPGQLKFALISISSPTEMSFWGFKETLISLREGPEVVTLNISSTFFLTMFKDFNSFKFPPST